jgi:hypothetical protein
MTDTSEARWRDWDYSIAPSLQNISQDAKRIQHLAEAIGDRCERLKYRPTFETIAESELSQAIKTIEDAMFRLRQARLLYRNKGPMP